MEAMRFVSAIFLIAALLFTACEDESTSGELPPADDVLMDSAAAVSELSSFHFELTQEDGIIPLPQNLDLESAEGDVALPDRLMAELRAEAQGLNVTVEAIAIGGDTWITNPFTRRWQRLDGVDLREFADIGALLPSLIPAIQDPQLRRETTLDGITTYEIEGSVDTAQLQEALPFSLPNREVTAELWIGVEDSLPRRVRIIGQLISGEPEGVVRQVDLSRFDEPVEINPP